MKTYDEEEVKRMLMIAMGMTTQGLMAILKVAATELLGYDAGEFQEILDRASRHPDCQKYFVPPTQEDLEEIEKNALFILQKGKAQ